MTGPFIGQPAGNIWAFIGASLLLALTPGPDIVTVMMRSVSQGIGAGLVAAAGFASGLTFHTTLAAAGIAAVLAASPKAMTGIRWAGALYLLYLAVRMALSRDAIRLDVQPAQSRRRGWAGVYGQSVVMNVLNPKVTLFFLGFLPGFVDRSPGQGRAAWLQVVILGMIFAGCTLLCFGGCAVFAGGILRWLRARPGAGTGLRWATVILFVGIGLWIGLA